MSLRVFKMPDGMTDIALDELQAALDAAGVDVQIGLRDGCLLAFDGDWQQVDLPDAALPVVQAFRPIAVPSLDMTGRTVDLPALLSELKAARVGIDALGGRGDALIAYADGRPIEWPAEAVVIVEAHRPPAPELTRDERIMAAAVVAAHVPPPAPVAPDYGDEAPTDFERQAAAVVASLREYLALSSPTGAQTVAALKVLIRVVLALLRRTL